MKNIIRSLRKQEKIVLKTAEAQLRKIRRVIGDLESLFGMHPNGPKPQRRKMSAAARAKISKAMRARWAKKAKA